MDPAPLPPAPESSRISPALGAWITGLAKQTVREHLTQHPQNNQEVGGRRSNRVVLKVRKQHV